MKDLAAEVLDLMVRLSSPRHRGRVVEDFATAMTTLCPGVVIRPLASGETNSGEVIELSTPRHHFGRVSLEFTDPQVATSHRRLCHQAIRLVTVLLENQAVAAGDAEHGTKPAGIPASAEQFQRALECSADAIFFGDAQGNFTWTNRQACKLTGLTAEEFAGKSIRDLFPAVELNRAPLRFDLLKQGRSVVTTRLLQRKDGSLVPVEMHSAMMPDGSYQSVMRDLTERIKAEQAVRESEEKYRTLFETMAQGVVYQDAEGRIISANPAAERILGLTLLRMAGRLSLDARWRTLREDGTDLPADQHPALVSLRTGQPVKDFVMGVYNPKQKKHRWMMVSVVPQFRPGQTQPYQVYSTITDITERKQAEDAVQAALREWQITFDAVGDGICLLDGDQRVLRCNQTMLTLLGKKREDLLGRHCWEIVHGTPEPLPECPVLRMRATRRRESMELSFGGRWFLVSVDPLLDGRGKLTGVVHILRDITERKATEEALRDSEQRLRAVVTNVPVVLFAIDANGTFILSEGKGLSSLGLQPGQVVGQSIFEIYRDVPPILNGFRRALAGEAHVLTIQVSGLVFETWYSPLRNPGGTIVGVIGVGADVTERTHAEAEIRMTNEELMALNRIVTACTASLDFRGALDRVLGEALRIVGLEGGTICLVQPDQTLTLVAHRATSEQTIRELSENQIHVGECLCGNCARDCQPLILRDRAAVRKYASRESLRQEGIAFHAAFPLIAQNQCVGVLCLFTRTDQKPAERRLKLLETVTAQVALTIRNAQLYRATLEHAATLEDKVRERTSQLAAANQELEAFSFSVSHDLRAPLRHIAGYAQAVSDHLGTALNPEGRRLLDVIQKAARKMSQLIEDLLAFSRMGRTELRQMEVDLNSLVGEIIREMQRDHPHRPIEWSVADLPTVRADLALIRQVWINLIGNAVKYTRIRNPARIEIGGRASSPEETVPADAEPGHSPDGTALARPCEWVFSVRDNGVGFNMEYAHRLFGVFQRLHSEDQFEGTGIGLANVRRIIHRHSGRVWAEAELDRGATFYFTLPVETTTAAPDSPASPPP